MQTAGSEWRWGGGGAGFFCLFRRGGEYALRMQLAAALCALGRLKMPPPAPIAIICVGQSRLDFLTIFFSFLLQDSSIFTERDACHWQGDFQVLTSRLTGDRGETLALSVRQWYNYKSINIAVLPGESFRKKKCFYIWEICRYTICILIVRKKRSSIEGYWHFCLNFIIEMVLCTTPTSGTISRGSFTVCVVHILAWAVGQETLMDRTDQVNPLTTRRRRDDGFSTSYSADFTHCYYCTDYLIFCFTNT